MKRSELSVTAAAALAAVLMTASSAAFAQNAHQFIITSSGGTWQPGVTFTAVKVGTPQPIATATDYISRVIDTIRDYVYCGGDAACPDGGGAVPLAVGGDVSIQFGDGINALDIGSSPAYFLNGYGLASDPDKWGNITISGKITSAIQGGYMGAISATIVIGKGVSVTSAADIANTNGPAIGVERDGTVKIVGGTVSSTGGYGNAVDFNFVEESQSGFVILGGSPTIAGKIMVSAGKLSIAAGAGADAFAPAGKQYTVTISRSKAGDVAVAGGAAFANSFILSDNGNFELAASGGDLVLYDPTTSTAARTAPAAGRFGIAQSGASLRIVGTSQAALLRVYDMRGKLLMSRKAMPDERISVSHLARGTYVAKAAGQSIRLTR